MAPVNGGAGGDQGGRGPDQQQAEQPAGPGEDPRARGGTSTRASARARRTRSAQAKAEVPAQSQGSAQLPGTAPPPELPGPAESAAHSVNEPPAAASVQPDLILTVGGTLTPAVPEPGPAAAEDARPGSPRGTGRPPDTPRLPPASALPASTAPPGAAAPGGDPWPPDGARSPGGSAPLDSAAPLAGRPAACWPAVPAGPGHDLAVRWARDYASGRPGQQITILYAGCVTATSDLGAGRLQAEGFDITVSMIDDDQPVTRAAVAASPDLARCTLGDLRTVPVPPRSYDLVLSSFVLDRVSSAELVLDRLTAAIKPGGLLFLSIHDRDSAAGFLDRVLPQPARRLVWRTRRPGQPGPHPAVYEPLSSARGVLAYAQLHGLVVAEWRPLRSPGRPGPGAFLAAQHAVSWLSRGRLTAAHEDLLYILRKPEDRFARVL